MALICLGASRAAAAVPRVESGGRVVVLDDFESSLDAWEGDARVELGEGAAPGSKALVWHCTDLDTTLLYKFANRIPDLPRYTRVAMDIRAWDDEGRKGPGVATYSYLVFGGLPWQLADSPPTWGLWDRQPVFGNGWRRVSYCTRYPEWYSFGVKYDNARPAFSLGSSALFAMNATVVLDNIRLIADPVEILGMEEGGVWGEGRWLPSGDYRYDYRIHVRSLAAEAQTVRAVAQATPTRGDATRFRGGMVNRELRLDPGKEGVLAAYVEIPRRTWARLPDLYHEEMLVTVSTGGSPGTDQVVPLLATKPFRDLDRPVILHPPAWWAEERARFVRLDDKAREAALAPANALLERNLSFPDRPTTVQKRRINSGAEVEITGWSAEEMKAFDAGFAAVRTLGEAYQRSRDERYARKGVALMLELAGKHARYPWHGNYETSDQGQARIATNNLHESYWLGELAASYDLLLDSPSLTSADEEKIARDFLLPAARHQTVICSGFCNQTSARYTSAALCGLALGDTNLVQYAVYGHHGLAISAEASISPDGFLTEVPINYHWANLVEMLRLPLVCRNAGLKVDVATARIRQACDSPYLRALPNLDAPPFGACGYGTGANFGLGHYPLVAQLFGDPKYRQLADPAEAARIVSSLPSITFPQGGMVVLREADRPGPNRTVLAILSTNRRRTPDGTLHFVLYSEGALLCPSPGTLYNATGETDWVSPWNNTLYVDGGHQRPSWGKVLATDFSGKAQMALIDAGAAYAGVRLQRAVALANGLVFLIDRAAGEAEHTYERVQMAGQEIARAPAQAADLERREGEHVRLRGTRLDGDWAMQWRMQHGPSLELAMAGSPGTEVLWGENRVNGFKPRMYAPTVLARRRAKETVFLTVMEPFRFRAPRLKGARRVPVLVGSREARDGEAAAVEALTDHGSTLFVASFDSAPKTCRGHAITRPLSVIQE